MKTSLLRIMICPVCGGSLAMSAFRKDRNGKEIMEGVLECRKCSRWYPLIDGIPRMLPLSMINKNLLKAFLGKYSGRLPADAGKEALGEIEKIKEKTSKSFGFQWNVFSEMFREYEENFLEYIKPLQRPFFRKKLVLDAGCGFGRHTYYAAKYGAEVVGFDLSDAVGAAYRNCGKMPKVHIVQGDIYNPPFRKDFDFIMSIGVLHHLPEPEKGFMSLVNLMGPKAKIFIWLYGREGRWFKIHVVEGIIRKVTTRMPHRLLYCFCYLPAGVYHLCNIIYNSMARHGATKGASRFIPFRGYAKFTFGVKHADAFDLLGTPINNYYTREQVERWGRDAKLKNISVTSMEGRSWRLFGGR